MAVPKDVKKRQVNVIVKVGNSYINMSERDAESLWHQLGDTLFEIYVERYGIDPDSEPF